MEFRKASGFRQAISLALTFVTHCFESQHGGFKCNKCVEIYRGLTGAGTPEVVGRDNRSAPGVQLLLERTAGVRRTR